MDPNEGVPEDAISVYCDFSFNATCLFSNEERKVRLKAALCIIMKFLKLMRAVYTNAPNMNACTYHMDEKLIPSLKVRDRKGFEVV